MNTRSFTQNMLRLVPEIGISQAFYKFLDVAIAINSDHDDPFYLRKFLINFNKEERYIFMETYTALLLEISGDGSGLNDVLGEFMIRNIRSPVRIHDQKYYDTLPGLINCKEPATRLTDYDCNTGRRFLAAAKFNRNLRFYGTDSFLPFVKISLLNLCLNGLYGEIAYSTAFNLSLISIWSVDLNYKGKTVIRELQPENSLIWQKRKEFESVNSKLIYNF
jgi:hypothetical protein